MTHEPDPAARESRAGAVAAGEALDGPRPAIEPGPLIEARPLIERLGLAAIAGLLAAVFGALAWAAAASGELFLGVMAGIGALMTLWAAASTLRR